jgi:hypothetical protein
LLAFNLDPHFHNTPDGLISQICLKPTGSSSNFTRGETAQPGTSYHLEVDRLRRNTTELDDGPKKKGGLRKGANEWRPFLLQNHGFLMKAPNHSFSQLDSAII